MRDEEAKTRVAIKGFLTAARYRGLAPKTISAYSWALDKLARAQETLPTRPEQLMELISDKDLAPTSRHDLRRVLRTFYRWIYSDGRQNNPMERVPALRTRRQLPRTLEAGEISRLLASARSRRDRAMVAMILDTGARVGELAALRWENIKLNAVHVDGKTGARIIPISSRVRQLLIGLGDGDHIWMGRLGPMTRSGVEQTIRKTLWRAGFRPPKAGAHMLRHTFGRHYIMAGGDVFSLQRIMGHADVSTTMLYVHLSISDLEEQHRRFSPMRNLELLTEAMDLHLP